MQEEKDLYTKRMELRDRQALLVQRTDRARFQRRLHVARREVEQERELLRAEEASNRDNQQVEEIKKLDGNIEEENKTVKSRQVRPVPQSVSCSDLIDLRSKLLEEKVRQEIKHAELIKQYTEVNSFERKRRQEMEDQQRTFRADLQNQLIANCLKRRENEEEKHRERKIVEQSKQVLQEEELNLQTQRREKLDRLRADRTAFCKAKQMWMDRQREIICQENKRIARVVVQKEEEQNKLTDEKSRFQKMREEMHEKFARKIFEKECWKFDRESINNEMHLMKTEEKLAKESLALAEKRERFIKEAWNEMANRETEIAKRKGEDKAIDVAFAEYLANEKRKDVEEEKFRMKELREKKAQYAKDLIDMIKAKEMGSANDSRPSNICQSKINLENETLKV